MKLPPYAKRLLERRRAGEHPPRIDVIVGRLWSPGIVPFIAMMPQEFQRGRFDWRCLVAAAVDVIDCRAQAGTSAFEPRQFVPIEGDDPLLWIAAEIAAVTAPVRVVRLWSDPEMIDIASAAAAYLGDARTPAWWSERDERRYLALLIDHYVRAARARGADIAA